MKTIGILTGGTSSEREVALSSAKTVEDSLRDRYSVRVYDFPNDLDTFIQSRNEIDVAIPVFHGKGGEDGVIQGFLETLEIPYLFSSVTAHAIGLDKDVTKKILKESGLQIPSSTVVRKGDTVTFSTKSVVKPINGGSSIGINIANSQEELDAALEEAFRYADAVMVEQYIAGNEYTVAVIDEGGEAMALPVIQIIPKTHEFFDFETKYDADLVDEVCPAEIDEALSDKLQKAGLLAHQGIGARHITRSDFIVDENGTPWFLEINTIPGQTLNSLVPKAIRASGRTFEGVLSDWIERI